MIQQVTAGSAQVASAGTSSSQVTNDVDKQNGIDTEGVGALIREARRVIIAARSALS